MTRTLRGTSWLLIAAGAGALLYAVYLVWFTGLETQRAQQDLAQQWTTLTPSATSTDDVSPDLDDPVTAGDAYAALWFERNGRRILTDDVLYVVSGITLDVLRAGPGHYPDTAAPGQAGNAAIAGHRTTYGNPFADIDQLAEGDTIHIVDRAGNEWVYTYAHQQVVEPTAWWVIDDDPLDSGAPTITLTTCHPRYSAAQRLVVWGELSSATPA